MKEELTNLRNLDFNLMMEFICLTNYFMVINTKIFRNQSLCNAARLINESGRQRVSVVHLLGSMKFCTKFHNGLSNSC